MVCRWFYTTQSDPLMSRHTVCSGASKIAFSRGHWMDAHSTNPMGLHLIQSSDDRTSFYWMMALPARPQVDKWPNGRQWMRRQVSSSASSNCPLDGGQFEYDWKRCATRVASPSLAELGLTGIVFYFRSSTFTWARPSLEKYAFASGICIWFHRQPGDNLRKMVISNQWMSSWSPKTK